VAAAAGFDRFSLDLGVPGCFGTALTFALRV